MFTGERACDASTIQLEAATSRVELEVSDGIVGTPNTWALRVATEDDRGGRRLAGEYGGHAGLKNASFLRGDLLDGAPQELLVIEGNGGDHA